YAVYARLSRHHEFAPDASVVALRRLFSSDRRAVLARLGDALQSAYLWHGGTASQSVSGPSHSRWSSSRPGTSPGHYGTFRGGNPPGSGAHGPPAGAVKLGWERACHSRSKPSSSGSISWQP